MQHSDRKCPACRAQFERLLINQPAAQAGPPLAKRMPTFELVAEGGMSAREYLLTMTLEPFVLHKPAALPAALLEALSTGLALSSLAGDEGTAPLFRATRDRCWTDLIDPDLCLAPTASALRNEPRRWQAAEADVDDHGRVSWASWVHHLDSERHRALLGGLAEALGLALPQLEVVSGTTLRARRLQVVVAALQHELQPAAPPEFYRISDWHMDGSRAERVLATATCYVEIGEGLTGGGVEFTRQAEVFVDDPEASLKVQPASGSVIAFNNSLLLHRVHAMSGAGRRLLVAFHLIDPAHPQAPSAAELPRQLTVSGVAELGCASRRRTPAGLLTTEAL